MQTVIIVVHLMIVVVLIGAVLLQKSEGGGLGMGGGAGFMSSRGTANLLTRTTAVRGVGFFSHGPVSVLAGEPGSEAGLDHRHPGAARAIAAGLERSNAGDTADQRWSVGHAEKGRRATESGPERTAGAEVPISPRRSR